MERNHSKLVTIFGGSGFVGRYLVRELARDGWRVRVAVRRPDLAGFLQPMGSVGQVVPIQANIRDDASVAAAVANTDAVVNLVGILFEGGKQTFEAVQAEGAARVAKAAQAAGAERFVQMSAIGADAGAAAAYARTKAAGEAAALEANPDTVIVRPSIVFGPEDDFFNRFASMARISPALPVVSPDTRFQPVYAGDVGAFMAAAVNGDVPLGKAYELGGPDIMSFRALLELMLTITQQRRAIVEMPLGLARFQAKLMSILPKPPLTEDQIVMLQSDNVISDAANEDGRTLRAAGITPKSMAAILPTYLWKYRKGGQFAEPGSAS